MMLKSIIALFSLVLFFSIVTNVDAKRLLPRAKPVTPSSSKVVQTTSKGALVKVKFRGDRRAIVATFTNLNVASAVSYVLTYDSRGTTQGASGSISLEQGEPQVREILFGTCSHGVCRYDSGITNAKLIVTSTLKNGRKVVKSFRLKV